MELLIQSEAFLGVLLILIMIILVGGVILLILVLPLVINIYTISRNFKNLSQRVSEEGIDMLDDVQIIRERTAGFMSRQGPRVFEFFLEGLYTMFTAKKDSRKTTGRRTRKTK